MKKNNYKRIGDFIQVIDERNNDLKVETLLGLKITKQFIPSVANIIGTDMRKYKIIRKNQFACILMQVRRDKKVPVALQTEYDEALVSQAYIVFEVKDPKELLSEYLMMWMSRAEFDREACFYAVGGVRGTLEWEDFCDMELPVPSPEKQQEIVDEYNTILNRIKLNEQLNQKLEETAQTIYKEWFVNFEFPITQEYAESIGKPKLAGKPYKSNGGEMVWNDELDQEVPKGWEMEQINKVGNVVTGKTPSSQNPEHFGNETLFITPTDYKNYFKFAFNADRYLSTIGSQVLSKKIIVANSLLVTCIGSDMGKVVINHKPCVTNQQINSIILYDKYFLSFLFYYLKGIYSQLRNMAVASSTMLMINKTDFELIRILNPNINITEKFHLFINSIDKQILINEKLKFMLHDFKQTILSKMTRIDL